MTTAIKGHLPKNFVSLCIDKYYVQPIEGIRAFDKPSDAFLPFTDGTGVEDTTVYMICTGRCPNIIHTEIASDGASMTIAAGFVGVDAFKRTFTVSTSDFGVSSKRFVSLSQLPFREDWLELGFDDGSVQRVSAWGLCSKFGTEEFRDLSVYYIGKGDGENYKNGSLDRILNGHPAYSELRDKITREYIIAVVFARVAIIPMFTDKNLYPKYHSERVAKNDRWKTEVFEAAAIYYFKPLLNTLHKTNFPAPKIKQKAWHRDIDLVIGEMNTENLNVALYSDFVPPRGHHIFHPLVLNGTVDVDHLMSSITTRWLTSVSAVRTAGS
jgi:hypothetical protein